MVQKEETEINEKRRSVIMDFNDCLGRTCLKWSADGELTSVDLLLVLERLAQVDQEVTGLSTASLDRQPCASIS
jgi:hypothetical protein